MFALVHTMKHLFLFLFPSFLAACQLMPAPDLRQAASRAEHAVRSETLPQETVEAACEDTAVTAFADTVADARFELPAPRPESGELLIEHTNYVVAFDTAMNIPFWVAWAITPEELIERESRGNTKFLPDPKLGCDALNTKEYSHSGWDRGHMCPAGDNRYHWRAMDESFYMTNICPQHHNLNRGDWKELEELCRALAAEEPVYVACGPILYKTPKHGYIGKNVRIRVPDAFFKVVLTGIAGGDPKAAGYVFKNEAGNHKLDKYVNSVDEVERLTGLDFFTALPDSIEQLVEAEARL